MRQRKRARKKTKTEWEEVYGQYHKESAQCSKWGTVARGEEAPHHAAANLVE